MPKVKAIKMGFYRGARKRPGEVFDVDKGEKASWFVQRMRRRLAQKPVVASTARRARIRRVVPARPASRPATICSNGLTNGVASRNL
jgi:hypothetical protein